MRKNRMGLALLAAAVAVSGCAQQDRAESTAANPGSAQEITEREAASQNPVGLPDTQPTSQTEIGMPGMPQGGEQQGVTLTASQSAGPGGAAYLVDTSGTAVYVLEGDTDGTKCSGDCLSAWPPVSVGNTQAATSGALPAGATMGSVQRPDGSMQVTYNAQPLYRYAADSGAGSTAGHNVKDQWGHWRLVTPQGQPVQASR